MKHIIKTLLLIIIATSSLQTANAQLTADEQFKVDSISRIIKALPYFKPHGKMISFTQFGIDSYENFWKYLMYDKKYKTNTGNVDVVETKGNYKVVFYKVDDRAVKFPITIDVVPVKGDENLISQATIKAPFSVLADLYLNYFGGKPKEGLLPKGGLDKTYTPTDEVRIYSDRILITPLSKVISTD